MGNDGEEGGDAWLCPKKCHAHKSSEIKVACVYYHLLKERKTFKDGSDCWHAIEDSIILLKLMNKICENGIS